MLYLQFGDQPIDFPKISNDRRTIIYNQGNKQQWVYV